jgi:hypothetical protein
LLVLTMLMNQGLFLRDKVLEDTNT